MPEEPLAGQGLSPAGPVITVLGPTAVGKSRHALELSQEVGGVIVSADSRQVYRYMDIGTDKPTPADRTRVPHYMIDVIEPSETYSAQRFAREAGKVLKAMALPRRPVFVVGGSGFYVSVLLDRRLGSAISPDPHLRARLQANAAQFGAPEMH